MALTRAWLDALADQAIATLGDMTELVTYNSKATSTATLVPIANVRCHFARYRKAEMEANPMLSNARRVRIAYAALAVEPTRYDSLVRSNGERWSVEAIEDGDLRPSWFLQVKQVV